MASSSTDAVSKDNYVPLYNEDDFPSYLKMVKAMCVNDLTFPLLSTENPPNAIEAWLLKYPAYKAVLRALPAPNTLMSDADLKNLIRDDPMKHGPAVCALINVNTIGTAARREELRIAWANWAAAEIQIYRVVAKSLRGHE